MALKDAKMLRKLNRKKDSIFLFQLNLSTMAAMETKESGRCRGVTVSGGQTLGILSKN